MRSFVVAAAGALMFSLPALAQPQTMPKRDYSGVYRVEGSPMGGEMRIAYNAATRIQRVEGGPMGMTLLIDVARGSVTMINSQMRSFFELTGGDSRPPWTDTDKYRFERIGTDRVANTPCTVWRMVEGPIQRGTSCATDDGIMLRAEWQHQQNSGKIEATSFTLAAQPVENFRVPPGYQKMEFPGMPPGVGQPPRR